MATTAGPNFTEEGVVLHYDLDNSKSYKGEPTVNHVPNASTMDGWSPYSAGNDGTFITEFGTTGYRISSRASWNGLYRSITVPTAGTHTVSAWFRYLGGTSGNNGAQVYINSYSGGSSDDYGIGLNKNLVGKWQRVSVTRNIVDTTFNFYIISYGGSSSTDFSSWEVTMPQVELNDHATQFVDGSRSNTEGLLDYVTKSSFDLSNVSFNSSAQMTFDGTNDTISLGDTSRFNITSEMSVFTWIKLDSNSGWKGIFGGAISGFVHFQLYSGGVNIYVYGPNTAYGNPDGAFIGTNVWTNVGFTFGGNTLRVYLNGEELPTTVEGNQSNITSNSDVRIGWAYDTSRLFQGQIQNLTVHNRALSPKEIEHNFNGTRSRFGI